MIKMVLWMIKMVMPEIKKGQQLMMIKWKVSNALCTYNMTSHYALTLCTRTMHEHYVNTLCTYIIYQHSYAPSDKKIPSKSASEEEVSTGEKNDSTGKQKKRKKDKIHLGLKKALEGMMMRWFVLEIKKCLLVMMIRWKVVSNALFTYIMTLHYARP